MAVWQTINFVGGALGTGASLATEPEFMNQYGSNTSLPYVVAPEGSPGQAIELASSGTGDFELSLGGRTRARIGIDVWRVSGTQSLGQAWLLWRNGTTNRGDCFLRNQNGGNVSLRGDTANATNYHGQSTRTFANGEVYHLEMEWQSGVGFSLYQWWPGNNTLTPDEVYTSSMTLPVTAVRIGNPSGTSGITVRMAALRASDGEQIRVITPIESALSLRRGNAWLPLDLTRKVAGAWV